MRQKRNINSLQTILKQEGESIRDFTRRFGQAVQQVESYSMDAVLQNFMRSFEPSTPLFQSLSLDLLATMEELYRRADKYPMLEDNIHAITHIVLITNQPTEVNKSFGKKPSESKEGQDRDRKRSCDQSQKRRELPQLTHLNILYKNLLPIICDLLEFKWPVPIQIDPSQRNRSLWCDYHRDHGHETDRCRSLKFLVEKLIKVGHLWRYVKEGDHREELGKAVDRITTGAPIPTQFETSHKLYSRRPT